MNSRRLPFSVCLCIFQRCVLWIEMYVPLKVMLKSLPLAYVNVPFLGNRALADVIKLRSTWIRVSHKFHEWCLYQRAM